MRRSGIQRIFCGGCSAKIRYDILIRYGGDEFAVLGDWFGQEQIEEAIARIQEGIDRFNKEGQLPLQLSMSIGYAFWHEAGRRGENLIQQADERMYEEKQKKKRMRA